MPLNLIETTQGGDCMNISFWLIVMGGLFILMGALSFKKESHLRRVCTSVAQAKIVAIEKELDENSTIDTTKKYVYTSIYEYTVGERVLRVKGMSSKARHKIGDIAQIHYNPDDPSEFYIGGSSGFSNIGAILTIIGLLIILLGIAQI